MLESDTENRRGALASRLRDSATQRYVKFKKNRAWKHILSYSAIAIFKNETRCENNQKATEVPAKQANSISRRIHKG